MGFGVVCAVALAVGGIAAITASVAAPALSSTGGLLAGTEASTGDKEPQDPVPLPQAVTALPAPTIEAAPAIVDICAIPEFVAAMAAVDDSAAIAAAGGAEAFRLAVASGAAPCVSLSDPLHVWVVVNKARPYSLAEYQPSPTAAPAGMRNLSSTYIRADAAAALTEMTGAAAAAGAGEIALSSGFRSYAAQRSVYRNRVASHGAVEADLVSARPGHSEHQSGLAADVSACAGGCAGHEVFGGTPQQAWVAEHSWEFGWIVRYMDGETAVTGYAPEPWHLRYIGPELAAAYHAGGWRSLEAFMGLPAAPDYLD